MEYSFRFFDSCLNFQRDTADYAMNVIEAVQKGIYILLHMHMHVICTLYVLL